MKKQRAHPISIVVRRCQGTPHHNHEQIVLPPHMRTPEYKHRAWETLRTSLCFVRKHCAAPSTVVYQHRLFPDEISIGLQSLLHCLRVNV
jgi:hypothetical protein